MPSHARELALARDVTFSPFATSHAELRQRLDTLERVLAFQRVLTWASRGLAVGLLVDAVLEVVRWVQSGFGLLPPALLVGLPLVILLAAAILALLPRTSAPQLARRVDRAGGLQERVVTALELGERGLDYPLAIAQVRDALEHLRRVDPLELFPVRAPVRELAAAVAAALLVAALILVPNPLRARVTPANPAAAAVKDQATRVQSLADSIPDDSSGSLDQLRALLSQGAQTVSSQSNSPDNALTSLQDLQQAVRAMSSDDDSYAAALAAVQAALAGNQATQQLASAISTGDLQQVARAERELAQETQQMTPQDRAQLAQTLQQAASAAGGQSPALAQQLASAANSLSQDPGDAGAQQAGQALDGMGDTASAAGERQRASNQLQSSASALQRALGENPSSGVGRPTSPSGQSTQADAPSGADSSDQGSQPGSSQGQGQGDQGQGDQGSAPQGNGNGGDNSQQSGGGSGTGTADHTGDPSLGGAEPQLQQDSSGQDAPNQSSTNAYLSGAASGSSQAQAQQVNPSYAPGETQGGQGSGLPLGLRDLVRSYFSSVDQQK